MTEQALSTSTRKSWHHFWGWLMAILLILVGFGLRLYDLTDEPLDFHSTRQLRGALLARHYYYQILPDADPETRQLAYSLSRATGQYEPPIFEKLVAWTYRIMGSENLWVTRIWTSLFWCVGGLFIFDLIKRMMEGKRSSNIAALVSLSYYLFLPFAVQASRSFQPDPGMVMWIIIAINFSYRWSTAVIRKSDNKSTWILAILAGLTGGMAALSKAVAVYIVAGVLLFLVLFTLGLKRAWRSGQAWSMAILIILPSALYYLLGREARAAGYLQSWTISLSHLLLDPTIYFRWFNLLVDLMGLAPLILATFGIALGGFIKNVSTNDQEIITLPKNEKLRDNNHNRVFLIGLWFGYIIYGLTLPYQMYTHTYYHLQLVPIIALSIAPSFLFLFEAINNQTKLARFDWIWRSLPIIGILIAIGYWSLVSIIDFRSNDYRNVPAYWQEIGSHLPTDGKIIGLTQDYGFPLSYYGWRKVTIWPVVGERQLAAMRGREKGFEEFFENRTADKSYFLITSFNQLNRQPDLKQYLQDNYPIFAEGSGYLIYDLQHPLNP